MSFTQKSKTLEKLNHNKCQDKTNIKNYKNKNQKKTKLIPKQDIKS